MTTVTNTIHNGHVNLCLTNLIIINNHPFKVFLEREH